MLAGENVNDALACQCAVKRIDQPGNLPFGFQVRERRLSGFWIHTHCLTIQLVAESLRRAATAVRSPLYCKATTQASVSRVPSEFCNRSMSANSRGRLEANKTSRAVPNSTIVVSLAGLP